MEMYLQSVVFVFITQTIGVLILLRFGCEAFDIHKNEKFDKDDWGSTFRNIAVWSIASPLGICLILIVTVTFIGERVWGIVGERVSSVLNKIVGGKQ